MYLVFFHDADSVGLIHLLNNSVHKGGTLKYRDEKGQSVLLSLFDTFRRCSFVCDRSYEDGNCPGVLHWAKTRRRTLCTSAKPKQPYVELNTEKAYRHMLMRFEILKLILPL